MDWEKSICNWVTVAQWFTSHCSSPGSNLTWAITPQQALLQNDNHHGKMLEKDEKLNEFVNCHSSHKMYWFCYVMFEWAYSKKQCNPFTVKMDLCQLWYRVLEYNLVCWLREERDEYLKTFNKYIYKSLRAVKLPLFCTHLQALALLSRPRISDRR